MNLQHAAYLQAHERQARHERLNLTGRTRPSPHPTSYFGARVRHGLHLLGRLQAIHVHVSFDVKEIAHDAQGNL